MLELILTHPSLFASIGEPDMIKPPVVYVVGAMRALGVGVTDSTASDYLDAMGELPYFPPNVSGWEGGLSWLNTDTALARFNFVTALLENEKIADVPGESRRRGVRTRLRCDESSHGWRPARRPRFCDHAGTAASSDANERNAATDRCSAR